MLISFKHKTVLITGAGSGIGRASALEFASLGARILANDVDASAAEAIASEVGGIPLAGDVANPSDWLRPTELGPIHALIHNAGYDLATPVGGTDMGEFDKLLRVMASGPFEMTQRLVQNLADADGAAVIFVSSVHGQATEPECSAYAAAKGAQIAMARSMCQDLGGRKIRVLNVSPGYVDTPLLDEWFEASPPGTRERVDALHPLGRMGQPEDVAWLVAFLASDLAEFVNGVNVTVDGGLTARLTGNANRKL